MRAAEARGLVTRAVVPPILAVLSPASFEFRRAGLAFEHQTDDAEQSVILGFDVNPPYSDAEIVLNPTVRITYPRISPLTALPGIPDTGVAIVQPIAAVGPPGGPRTWSVRDGQVADRVGAELAAFIAQYLIAFLDVTATPSGLLRAYESGDTRVVWHRQAVASTVAISWLEGQRSQARSIAAEHFRGAAMSVEFPALEALMREA